MKKAVLKLYIKRRLRPLFVAEIYDDVESTIKDLIDTLNDTTNTVITFGNITFARELFKWLKIRYS